jgi:hypothetical protein
VTRWWRCHPHNEISGGNLGGQTSGVLSSHNIKSVGLPHKKVSGSQWPVKDNLGLRALGVYRIHYECGRVTIGQTGRSMETRLKEHQQHIRLEHRQVSHSWTQHRFWTPHSISLYLHSCH